MTFNEETKNHKNPLEVDRANRRGAMYQEPGDPLCPVSSLEKYLSKIPPDAKTLYLQPKRRFAANDSIWYSSVPLGVNQLSNMLPRLCKEAGTLSSYTNHSIRATTIQKLSDAGLQAREIIAVSGHRREKAQTKEKKSKRERDKSRACRSWSRRHRAERRREFRGRSEVEEARELEERVQMFQVEKERVWALHQVTEAREVEEVRAVEEEIMQVQVLELAAEEGEGEEAEMQRKRTEFR
ncbi:hypothetical protein DPX16_1905 [Anabarilius grahami]|uniref:ZMYM2-like/QRICH1 C-terminal domain-containing protein n=1 Tax=Anabarilius grahami TaxID=495550 RepID=A0A3N0Z173_ANAGA|nr:hypothetical protein DPX16_1905 [Anabarilius grahami]